MNEAVGALTFEMREQSFFCLELELAELAISLTWAIQVMLKIREESLIVSIFVLWLGDAYVVNLVIFELPQQNVLVDGV